MRNGISTGNNDKESTNTVVGDSFQTFASWLSSFWPDTTNQQERYIKWWVDDYSPICGRLRFVIHVGLWYFASNHKRSYFNSLKEYAKTDPEFFTPRGLFGLVLGNYYYMDPQIIRILVGITKVAWISAAVGLFTGISSAVTAIGALFLQGYLLDVSGGNRGWYVPTAAFVAMAFSKNRRDDVWSVDHLIEKYLRRRGTQQDDQQYKNTKKKKDTANDDSVEGRNHYCFNSLRETGFARKCLLVYIVGFYFASGMAKIYSSGFRWADGNTLLTILRKAQTRDHGKNTIVNLLVTYPNSLGMLSAASALFLEAGAFFAFHKKSRLLFLLGWASMHIMIKLTMERKYEQNAWCYLLLVDWDEISRMMWTRRRANNVEKIKVSTSSIISRTKHWWRTLSNQDEDRQQDMTRTPLKAKDDDEDDLLATNAASSSIVHKKKIGGEEDSGTTMDSPPPTTSTISRSSAKFATSIGSCLLLAMVAQALLQIEWWPFTNVDMYSSYRHGDIKYSYHKSKYDDPVAAQEIANSWGNRQAKGVLSKHVEMHLVLRKKKQTNEETKEEEEEIGQEEQKKKMMEMPELPLDDDDDDEKYYQKIKTLGQFGVARNKQWRKSVMTDIVVEDFRAKPMGTIAYDSENFPDNPASLFLLHILPSLKRNVKKWKKYEYVILTYETPDEAGPDPVIASIPLDDAKLKELIEKIEKLKMTRQKAGWWWGGNTYYTTPSYYMKTNTVFVLVAHLCVIVGFRVHVFWKSRRSFKKE